MKQKNILAEIDKNRFRVAIFGSARIKAEDKIYQEVFELAEKIGENDFDVVTGGGPGLMEAATRGHHIGSKGNGQSIGLTIHLPWETKPEKHLKIKEEFEKFSGRLDAFMALSNVVVVMPGGIGTCLEFFYTWQLTQVKHICNIPIIVQGKMWKNLMDWIEKFPLKEGLISTGDMKNIFISEDNDSTIQVIQKANELFQKLGDSYCLNWKKYKLN